jgi:hypothetical protein
MPSTGGPTAQGRHLPEQAQSEKSRGSGTESPDSFDDTVNKTDMSVFSGEVQTNREAPCAIFSNYRCFLQIEKLLEVSNLGGAVGNCLGIRGAQADEKRRLATIAAIALGLDRQRRACSLAQK